MPKIFIQFDDDKPVEAGEVEMNKPFSLHLIKTDVKMGEAIQTKQESQEHVFTDGKKKMRIYIE